MLKVTLEPAQIGPEGFALIVTEGTKTGFTVITIALLETGTAETQASLLVNLQEMLAPLVKLLVAYVEEVCPEIKDVPLYH